MSPKRVTAAVVARLVKGAVIRATGSGGVSATKTATPAALKLPLVPPRRDGKVASPVRSAEKVPARKPGMKRTTSRRRDTAGLSQVGRLYRKLLRAAVELESSGALSSSGALLQRVRRDFRRQAAATMASEATVDPDSRRPLRHRQLLATAAQVERLCSVFTAAATDETLVDMLNGALLGAGNEAYMATVTGALLPMLEFSEQRDHRKEADDAATEEQQNRVMQRALVKYAEQLCVVHRDDLSDDALRALLSQDRGNTKSEIFHLGSGLHIGVEIDEELQKQSIYVRSRPWRSVAGAKRLLAAQRKVDNLSQDSDELADAVDRLETIELDTSRGTVAHADWYRLASRVVDVLSDESSIHKSRGTIVAGHGIGGAVALLVALLLHGKGADVRNVISFGAPKALESTLDRHVAAVHPVRVLIDGDPLAELPISTESDKPFVHVGEALILVEGPNIGAARDTREKREGDRGTERKVNRGRSASSNPTQRFSPTHYAEVMTRGEHVELRYERTLSVDESARAAAEAGAGDSSAVPATGWFRGAA